MNRKKSRGFTAGSLRNDLTAYAFLAPFLAVFAIFFIWPVARGAYMSLYRWSIMGKVDFVGLQNYIGTFTSKSFYLYLWHSFYYVILSTPLLIGVGLGLALLINCQIKGRTFVRAAFFLPYVLSVSVVSFIWLKLYDSNRGLLNAVLQSFGAQGFSWLTDERTAWISVVITSVWWGVGFVMVLYLSALQEIPLSYYEAAGLDGASAWQKFRYITLPSLKNITMVQIFFQVIAGLKLFGQTHIMTKGGPGDTTRTMVMHIYNTGFKKDRFGEAAAISIIYCLIMLLFVMLQNARKTDQ